jgi:hypothetical protein
MPDAGQRREARRRKDGLVDRRVGIFLKESQEPAGGDSRMPARLLSSDQDRELERVDETQLRRPGPEGGETTGAAGHPYAAFQRALKRRNVLMRWRRRRICRSSAWSTRSS